MICNSVARYSNRPHRISPLNLVAQVTSTVAQPHVLTETLGILRKAEQYRKLMQATQKHDKERLKQPPCAEKTEMNTADVDKLLS